MLKIPSKICFLKIIFKIKLFFATLQSCLLAKKEKFGVWPVPLFADLDRIFQEDEVQLNSPVTASVQGRKDVIHQLRKS